MIQAVVRAGLATKGADIASAGTMDIGAVAGLYHDITGTTTVTGMGTVSAGIWKVLQFDGAVPLTYNASSMILPGNANITTAAGDHLLAVSLGSGNWVVPFYQKDTGLPVITDFPDSGFRIVGSSDSTKKLAFEVDGFTASNTRTITFPDADLTIPAVTAKGDLVAASASGTLARVAVSATDGDTLIADSTADSGLSYRTKISVGTTVATTSGTSVTIDAAVPSWVKRITLLFNGVSSSGTSNWLVQIGPSGGVETSSYVAASFLQSVAPSSVQVAVTNGFPVYSGSGNQTMTGEMRITTAGSSLWIESGTFLNNDASPEYTITSAGSKTITGTLARIVITTVNGTDTFDAGAITPVYE